MPQRLADAGLTMSLRRQALDSLQVLTIFVAFATVLFGIRYPTILAAATRPLPDAAKAEERKIERRRRRAVMRGQCLPLLVLIALPAYLFVPLSTRIARASEFNAWDFDPVTTGFIALTVYLLLLLVWSAWLVVEVGRKGGLRD